MRCVFCSFARGGTRLQRKKFPLTMGTYHGPTRGTKLMRLNCKIATVPAVFWLYSVIDLLKKFEEFQTHVHDKLPTPVELQSQSTIEKIQTKIDFFKTFAIETESISPENPHHREELGDKLSALDTNFNEWVNSGSIEGPVSPCSCSSSCFVEEEEQEDQKKVTNAEKMQEQEVEANKKENLTEEKNREELEVDLLKKYLENIVADRIEIVNKKRRQGDWIWTGGIVGVAAVVTAVGLALLGFGSVEKSVYFVPT